MTRPVPVGEPDAQPLRVGVVVSRFPVGSETFILRQLTGLVDHGCTVRILPLKPPTDEALPEDVAAYGLGRLVRYIDGPGGGVLRRIATAASALIAVVVRNPRGAMPEILRPGLGGLRRRVELVRVAAHIARTGPHDVLHCHFGPVGVTAAMASTLLADPPPLSVVFHGYDLSRTSAIDGPGYRDLFVRARVLLPVSDRWRERLLELGASSDRIVVHRMGVHLEQWAPLDRPPGETLRLVSVCRLVEKKGIGDAVDAIALLRDTGLRVHYTVVGDGPLRGELRAQVAALGLDETVELVGWAPPNAVRRHLAGADVLLAPSVTSRDGDQEGIPVSLMEAMATGMPVVATRHSGIPELVVDGVTGYLADERSPEQLAARIARLAADGDGRQTMGAAARRRVEELHDQRRLDVDLVELLRPR